MPSLEPTSMYKTLYLGLDAHTRNCVLAAMDRTGELVSTEAFSTSESTLIAHVAAIPGNAKYLAVEESPLAGWIASALRPYVTEVMVCDPLPNTRISRGGNKDDFIDAVKLCRLLRLGELKPVYHSEHDHRVDFKIAVQQYLRTRNDHAKLKNQIKATFQQAGIVDVTGSEVFTKAHRGKYLKRLPTNARRMILEHLYDRLDQTGELRKKACATMEELGKRYPEITQFQRVPGIGTVGAHAFSAYVQPLYLVGDVMPSVIRNPMPKRNASTERFRP